MKDSKVLLNALHNIEVTIKMQIKIFSVLIHQLKYNKLHMLILQQEVT